jgi:hypothetical protein
MNTLGFDEVTGSLAVANGPDLEGAVFLTLQRVGGSLTSGGNRRLSTLEFPELREVGGNVEIVGNVGLVRLDFDSLTRVGLSLIVRSNPDLPACRPEDFFGGVVVGGPVVIEGNCVTCCVAP